MTETMSDDPAVKPQAIQLTRRDIDDAKRLLALLAGAEGKIVIGPEDAEERSTPPAERALQQAALNLLSRRRRRHKIFGRAMFGEPAWEMLLLLYSVGPRETVGRLAELAYASKSTAIRWIDYLESQGLVCREAHPTDKRATFVELSDKGRQLIRLYLFDTTRSET
jgi:DNA-binding MarR family transcriptional regulator